MPVNVADRNCATGLRFVGLIRQFVRSKRKGADAELRLLAPSTRKKRLYVLAGVSLPPPIGISTYA